MTEEEKTSLTHEVLFGTPTDEQRQEFSGLVSGDPDFEERCVEIYETHEFIEHTVAAKRALDESSKPLTTEEETRYRRLIDIDKSAQPSSPKNVVPFLKYGTAIAAGIAILAVSYITFRPKNDPGTDAYLVVAEAASVQVYRAGQPISARDGFLLQAGDVIRAEPGVAHVIGVDGVHPVSGSYNVPPWENAVDAQAGQRSFKLAERLVRSPQALLAFAPGVRGADAAKVYAPGDQVTTLQPVVAWPGGATLRLDVSSDGAAVLDREITSPARLEPLQPERRYEWKLVQSGKTFAEGSFTTPAENSARPLATNDAEKLVQAATLLGAFSGDVSADREALGELLTLSETASNTPLALRLKATAFERVQLKREFEDTIKALK